MSSKKRPVFNIAETHGKYSIDEVLNLVDMDYWDPELVMFHEVPVNFHNQRLKIFKRDGIICAHCGLEGEYFELIRLAGKKEWALHLYAEKDGKQILFTKDHVIPKGRGGGEELENFQPMCYPCNRRKADTHPFEDAVESFEDQVNTAIKKIRRALAQAQEDIKEVKARKDGASQAELKILNRAHSEIKDRIDALKKKRKDLRGLRYNRNMRRNPADRLEELSDQLRTFTEQYNVPVQDRIQRGLDPIGMLALDDTRALVKLLAAQVGTSLEAVRDVTMTIQSFGPWPYAKAFRELADPAVRVWVMLNAANNLGKGRERDMTPTMFLNDVDRIIQHLKDAVSDTAEFYSKAREYTLEEVDRYIRVEDGVPVSEVDSGFMYMAIGGYDSGVIQDSDGVLHVGAVKINLEALEDWGFGFYEEMDRGMMVKFFYNADAVLETNRREPLFKLRFPGYAIVESRNFELAKAIAKASSTLNHEIVELSESALGHTMYAPTSAMEQDRDELVDQMAFLMPTYNGSLDDAFSNWGEQAVQETQALWFPRGIDTFYQRVADIKGKVIFLDTITKRMLDEAKAAQSKLIKQAAKQGREPSEEELEAAADKGETKARQYFARNFEARVDYTKRKIWQKMEELQYIISILEPMLKDLPPDVNTIVDMAGGVGDLGLALTYHLMSVAGHKIDDCRIVDPFSYQEGFDLLMKRILDYIPEGESLRDIVHHHNVGLQDAKIPSGSIVVAKHPCGDLADSIIENWVRSDSDVLAIMTCCQGKAASKPARYGFTQSAWNSLCTVSDQTKEEDKARRDEGMRAMTALDTARRDFLREWFFEAELFQTDQFPKGDLIVAVRTDRAREEAQRAARVLKTKRN